MSLSALNPGQMTPKSQSYSKSVDMAEKGIGSRLEMHSMAGPSFNYETTSRPLTPPDSTTTDVEADVEADLEGLASSDRSTQYCRPYVDVY